MRIRSIAASLVALALLTEACGRVTGPGDDGTDHPTGADRLLLRVATGGGFLPVDYMLRQLPQFSLMEDGRIITQGAQIEIYPGPALPSLLVTAVTDEGVQEILEAARAAGLAGPDRSYDCSSIADAPTTTFTFVDGDGTHVVSAYALAEGLDCPGLEESERDARATLLDLQTMLSDLRSWLPEGSVGEEQPFEFDELRVFVGAFDTIPEDPYLEQPVIDWPLAQPLASFGEPVADLEGFRCGTVHGEDLAQLLPSAKSANELTPWASDGATYHLLFRPLLPDENGC
ncbi:MAG: hypothetical protein ACT4PO_07075 [Actinomycetota bacterium]